MSNRSHCQQCGQRLRDAIFCPRCGQFLCSGRCLDEHRSQHLRLTAAADALVETVARDAALQEVRRTTVGANPVIG